MYLLNFNRCLIAAALLTTYLVSAEDNDNSDFNEQTLSTSERTVESIVENNVPDLAGGKVLPTLNSDITTHEDQASSTGKNLDAQETSASNKVVLVLDNDEDFLNSGEESSKRLTRNPDAFNNFAGQFQKLGDGVAQQLTEQVFQTAPAMSKTFGQALSEALNQTKFLAQATPAHQPHRMNFDQLNQNLFLGSTQNLFNPTRRKDSEDVAFGSAASASTRARAQKTNGNLVSPAPSNFFRSLPQFPQLPQINPFGMFSNVPALNTLLPLGSEISEVRVLPEQYSTYKVSPKDADDLTMAEIKLKMLLNEALNKKTLPILWFHLPTNLNLINSDSKMESKLYKFEQKIISELTQLQELAKKANDIKCAQLKSGATLTESLNTKLNLHEIPIHNITIADVEKTINDEHVRMLLQTLLQENNKPFMSYPQATTKYLTDLTGTHFKRDVKREEDSVESTENDDIKKIMKYAYHMVSLNGQEMPWIKRENMRNVNEVLATTEKLHRLNDHTAQTNLETKSAGSETDQMMLEPVAKRQMYEDEITKMNKHSMRHWIDPAMMQQQMPIQRHMIPQIPRDVPLHLMHEQGNPREMLPSQVYQQGTSRQVVSPQMQHEMLVQNQMQLNPPRHTMYEPATPRQILYPPMHQPRYIPNQMSNYDVQMQKGREMLQPDTRFRMVSPHAQIPMPLGNQMWIVPRYTPKQIIENRTMRMQRSESNETPEVKESAEVKLAQSFESKTPQEKQTFMIPTSTNIDKLYEPRQRNDSATSFVGAKPQMPENEGRARVKGNLFGAFGQAFSGMHQKFNMQQFSQNDLGNEHRPLTYNHYSSDDGRQPPMIPVSYSWRYNLQSTQPAPMFLRGYRTDVEDVTSKGHQSQVEQPIAAQNYTLETDKEMVKKHEHAKPPQNYTVHTNTSTVNTNKEDNSEKKKFIESKIFDKKQELIPESAHITSNNQAEVQNLPTQSNAKLQVSENGLTARATGMNFSPNNMAFLRQGDTVTTPTHHRCSSGDCGRAFFSYVDENDVLQCRNRLQRPLQQTNPYATFLVEHEYATGDEEIAAMLKRHQQEDHPSHQQMRQLRQQQQPQRQHHFMPIMMLNNENLMPITTTINAKNKAAHPFENYSKRLAKQSTERYKTPATYIIVVRNNYSKSGRSRRKRSAQYATLEPIDESSLAALRKAYKNSLKEIILNPDESPDEALIRYNAEAIREALEEANKQPMEIAAVQEEEEAKATKSTNEFEQYPHQRVIAEPMLFKQLPKAYIVREEGQVGNEISTNKVQYNVLQSTRQNAQPLSPSFINKQVTNTDVIPKHNTTEVYQHPFLSIKTSPYLEEHSGVNQLYQLAEVVDDDPKYIVYHKSDVQPHFSFTDFLSPTHNFINTNSLHYSTTGHYDNSKTLEYKNFVKELPTLKNHYTVSNMLNKPEYLDSYKRFVQPPIDLSKTYRFGTVHESSTLEHIIEVIKEQVIQSCNTCENAILKSLDNILRHQNFKGNAKIKVYAKNITYKNILTEEPHAFVYAKPSNTDEELLWEKNYDNKQHLSNYLTNDELNLNADKKQNSSDKVQKIFFKSNQYVKRETTPSQSEIQDDNQTEMDTAVMENEAKLPSLNEDEDDVVQEDNKAESEEDHPAREAKKQAKNKVVGQISATSSKKEIEVLEKNTTADRTHTSSKIEKCQRINAKKAIDAGEASRTHSVYDLTGQFQKYKTHLMDFGLQQDKKLSTFNCGNSEAKYDDRENMENKSDKMEQKIDILLDLIKSHEKAKKEISSIH